MQGLGSWLLKDRRLGLLRSITAEASDDEAGGPAPPACASCCRLCPPAPGGRSRCMLDRWLVCCLDSNLLTDLYGAGLTSGAGFAQIQQAAMSAKQGGFCQPSDAVQELLQALQQAQAAAQRHSSLASGFQTRWVPLGLLMSVTTLLRCAAVSLDLHIGRCHPADAAWCAQARAAVQRPAEPAGRRGRLGARPQQAPAAGAAAAAAAAGSCRPAAGTEWPAGPAVAQRARVQDGQGIRQRLCRHASARHPF